MSFQKQVEMDANERVEAKLVNWTSVYSFQPISQFNNKAIILNIGDVIWSQSSAEFPPTQDCVWKLFYLEPTIHRVCRVLHSAL